MRPGAMRPGQDAICGTCLPAAVSSLLPPGVNDFDYNIAVLEKTGL
ncbi:MAG: hypothetical protein HY812_18020 [Planctomycetes bacterium]|nr:hypothetical protein [Planctomycetota bacterium]